MTPTTETMSALQRRLAAARAAILHPRVWGLRITTANRRWWIPVSVIREVLPPARAERWPSQPAGAWGVREHRGQALTIWPWAASTREHAWVLWPRGAAWDARGLAFDGPGDLLPHPGDPSAGLLAESWVDEQGERVTAWHPERGPWAEEGGASG